MVPVTKTALKPYKMVDYDDDLDGVPIDAAPSSSNRCVHILKYICMNVYIYEFIYMNIYVYLNYIYLYVLNCLNRFHIGMNAFIFCVHYLCLIGRVYVFYVGHIDYETLPDVVILRKHHHQ
jgi:hypothetical protein